MTDKADPRDQLHAKLDGFALVLGASSGFGEACSLSLARAGLDIVGVHLDRRATQPHVDEIQARIRDLGREAWFYNVNAADETKRREVLDDVKKKFAERGKGESIRVLLHSLAFGTLLPFVPEAAPGEAAAPAEAASQKQIEMTLDVMANSLVYWVQDVQRRNMYHPHARIFAMTSTGSWSIWPKYGVVSAAKAALESHIRALAYELGPRGITCNALCAGVTDTAALRKIPGNDAMIAAALRKNPSHRLTTTEDVARAIVALAQPCLYWMNGNTINVDGGEAIAGRAMPAFETRDDRGRKLVLHRPPRRVVSLVPSDTYTVAKLAGVDRLVGRTQYCEEPRGEIERVPSVGGTKDYDVDAIVALAPDLVIANQEENTKSSLEALAQRGIPVFVVFPKRVDEGVALVARLARILGVERDAHARDLVRDCHRALVTAQQARAKITPLRVFCPIWADPLMTIHGDTYMSDALDLAGAQNVFSDRPRRYPLAADLRDAKPWSADKIAGRDTRYPRVTEAEVVQRVPELVLLPDEPHPFTEEDAARFRALDIPAAKHDRVKRIAGKDVCWYGAWSREGIPRLSRLIASFLAS